MATRALIVNLKTMESIYCHYDGYPSHVGYLLNEFYNDDEIISELFVKGNLVSLAETIEKSEFFVRDKKENWESNKPRIFSSKDLFIHHAKKSWCEYIYFWDGGFDNKWTVKKLIG